MYIRNILETLEILNDNEELCLHYRSGKESFAYSTDDVETVNGDLKITRNFENHRCIIMIDPAEVERIVLSKKVIL